MDLRDGRTWLWIAIGLMLVGLFIQFSWDGFQDWRRKKRGEL